MYYWPVENVSLNLNQKAANKKRCAIFILILFKNWMPLMFSLFEMYMLFSIKLC